MKWSDFDETERYVGCNLSKKEFDIQLADWLRTLRKKCGFTQDDIAMVTQRSRPTVSAWENTNPKNHRNPDYRDIAILSQLVYRIPVDFLLTASDRHDRRARLLSGYIIYSKTFQSVDGWPVYIDGENGFTGWVIVNCEKGCFISEDGDQIDFDDLRPGFFCSLIGPIDYEKRENMIKVYGKSNWMKALLIKEWPEWKEKMAQRVANNLKES